MQLWRSTLNRGAGGNRGLTIGCGLTSLRRWACGWDRRSDILSSYNLTRDQRSTQPMLEVEHASRGSTYDSPPGDGHRTRHPRTDDEAPDASRSHRPRQQATQLPRSRVVALISAMQEPLAP